MFSDFVNVGMLFSFVLMFIPVVAGIFWVFWFIAPRRNKDGHCSAVIAVMLMMISLVLNTLVFFQRCKIEITELSKIMLVNMFTLLPMVAAFAATLGILMYVLKRKKENGVKINKSCFKKFKGFIRNSKLSK